MHSLFSALLGAMFVVCSLPVGSAVCGSCSWSVVPIPLLLVCGLRSVFLELWSLFRGSCAVACGSHSVVIGLWFVVPISWLFVCGPWSVRSGCGSAVRGRSRLTSSRLRPARRAARRHIFDRKTCTTNPACRRIRHWAVQAAPGSIATMSNAVSALALSHGRVRMKPNGRLRGHRAGCGAGPA